MSFPTCPRTRVRLPPPPPQIRSHRRSVHRNRPALLLVPRRVGDPAVNDHGKWGHPVVFDLLLGKDMRDGPAPHHERVGDQRPMAAPGEGFGAHDGGPTPPGKIPELVEAASELFGLHVISEASEASAEPTAIGGFAALTLPEPSQPRQMDMAKAGIGE